ncbi:unnamed protein product, partial [Mesorhabditis spiculigera]
MNRWVVCLLLLPALVYAKCGTHTTCGDCAGAKDGLFSCIWCADDNGCVSSVQTDCAKTGQIKTTYDCPMKPPAGYEYNETLARNVAVYATAATNGADRAGIDSCLSKISAASTLQVTKPCDAQGDSCSGYLGYSARENLIIMAFRGSKDADQFLDEGVDFIFNKLTTMPVIGGKVDSYFYDAFIAIYPGDFETELKRLQLLYKNAGLLVVGHSLGGSMASIAAAYSVKKGYFTSEQVRLVTFGEPRTGDMDYAKAHDAVVKYTYRLVHQHDPVPHLPAKFLDNLFDNPFHHRYEVWYQNDMNPGAAYTVCDRADDDACSNSVTNQNIQDHLHYFNHDLSNWVQTGCA